MWLMASVHASGGDPLLGGSGPGSLAQGAAGLGATALVEQEEEHPEASLGHVCEQKAVISAGPWDALWCDLVTSPVT